MHAHIGTSSTHLVNRVIYTLILDRPAHQQLLTAYDTHACLTTAATVIARLLAATNSYKPQVAPLYIIDSIDYLEHMA